MNINTQNTNTETILLKDLVQQKRIEMKRGNVISKTTGQYPVYSSSVQNNGLMCYSDDYMFDEELISWSIDGGGDFFYRPKHKYSLTNVSGYIRVLDKNINCKYLYCILDLLHSKEHFNYTTKAHPSVICKMYKVPLPNIEVQKKIATILFTMKDLINKEQSTITKLKETKRSLLEPLFPSNNSNFPQLRFKNFTPPWEQRKFEELYDFASEGGTPDTNNSSFYESGNIPFVKIEDTETKYIDSTKSYITQKGLNNSSAWLIPENSVIFTNGATVGNVAINRLPVATKQGILGIIPSKVVTTEFMFYLLSSISFQREVKSRIATGTFATIILKNLNQVPVCIPTDKKEQKEISNYLSALDNLITLHQCK